jgi:hypothetical protein
MSVVGKYFYRTAIRFERTMHKYMYLLAIVQFLTPIFFLTQLFIGNMPLDAFGPKMWLAVVIVGSIGLSLFTLVLTWYRVFGLHRYDLKSILVLILYVGLFMAMTSVSAQQVQTVWLR